MRIRCRGGLCATVLAAGLSAALPVALAQPSPGASTLPVQPSAAFEWTPAPSAAELAAETAAASRALVRLFIDACVVTGGSYQAAVDSAIGQGLVPQDAEASGARALLDDRPGAVFAPVAPDGSAPPGGGVLLAVAERGHCLVWADRAHGPGVRLALQAALGERVGRGDRLEVELDRKLERGPTWRQQTQWRLRPAGSTLPLQVGLVNTLTDTPAPQVLRLQPFAPNPAAGPALPGVPPPGFAPDGQPLR